MKKVAVVFLALALLMTFATAAPAFAASTTVTFGNAYGMNYTQITGTLGGAAYVIRIPESWNGRLIVGCPAFQPTPNPNAHFMYDQLVAPFIAQGFAYAASNYGEEGYPIQKAVIRIHQLTEYVVDNYFVTGKIFLLGGSMGGQIVLLLGEKYPNLYSGVLDICGLKNIITLYGYNQIWIDNSPAELRIIFPWLALASDSAILSLKSFFAAAQAGFIKETGGTPEDRLQAYERISPVFHTDLRIPVISLVGAIDVLVPLTQQTEYQAVVASAGHSNFYKLYIVPNGGHLNGPIMAQGPARLTELISWSDSLD